MRLCAALQRVPTNRAQFIAYFFGLFWNWSIAHSFLNILFAAETFFNLNAYKPNVTYTLKIQWETIGFHFHLYIQKWSSWSEGNDFSIVLYINIDIYIPYMFALLTYLPIIQNKMRLMHLNKFIKSAVNSLYFHE